MLDIHSITYGVSYPGLFMLPILGSIGLPFPEEAVLMLCGAMIYQKIVQPVPAFFAVYFGVLLSDFIIFSFGRKFGRQLVTNKRFHRFLSPEKFNSIEAKIKMSGFPLLLFGRQIIGLRTQLFLVSGIMGINPRTFILIDSVAAALTVTIMIAAGYIGIDIISYLDMNNAYELLRMLIRLKT